MNKHRNTRLTRASQNLRREMTKEERHLWYDCLKSLPATFYRQKVMGNYIVDFYCAAAKLVIELDGSQHFNAEDAARDNVRDEFLRGLGLIVKRYSNADINQRFESVKQDIFQFLFPSEN